jgi:preprotein translocase subunit SecE
MVSSKETKGETLSVLVASTEMVSSKETKGETLSVLVASTASVQIMDFKDSSQGINEMP